PRRDRTLAGRTDQRRILGQGTRLVPGLLGTPVSTASLDLGLIDVELDAPGRDVHPDGVTILDQADETANLRLGGDVADAHPGRPSGEAPVGDEQHVLAETRSLDGAGDLEHLSHPGTTLRALGADDDHVTGLDLVVEESGESALLPVEHAGRADEPVQLDAGDLDHASLGGEVPPQDGDAALGG